MLLQVRLPDHKEGARAGRRTGVGRLGSSVARLVCRAASQVVSASLGLLDGWWFSGLGCVWRSVGWSAREASVGRR